MDDTSSMALMYDSCESPSPPYSRGILIPKAPRSRRPWITASGISPSRSMRSESTCSRSSRSSLSRKGCASRISSGSCSGYGWMRSRRNFPRNRSRTKLGAVHSCSRAASATSRASSALTLRSRGVTVVAMGTSCSNLSALTGPRSGGDSPRATMRSLAMRHSLPLVVTLALRTALAAQTPRPTPPPPPPAQPILVKAGRLIDGRSDVPRSDVVPGPHIFASTRAMAPTGMYPIVSDNWELELPHGVQPVDGVEGARLAVRQQVAHGADWIKFYADRRYYFGADSVLHSWVNFTDDEARAIVDEAHRLG